MKKMIALLVLILSTYASATNDTAMQEKLNLVSKYESKMRKYESELMLKTKQLDSSTQQITSLNNQYTGLASNYRQLAGQAQYLKFQNDRLVKELKDSGAYTPELAQKMDRLKGRLPASIKSRK